MIQRIRDWRNERRIKRLSRLTVAHMRLGDRARVRLYWGLMCDAISDRSQAQVLRMERKAGIHHA